MKRQDTKIYSTNSVDRIISILLYAVYFLLLVFLAISITSPQYLKDASEIGRKSEAKVLKAYGDKFLNDKNYEMALIQYQEAVDIYPDFSEAYSNMGIAYKFLGDNKKSLVSFDKALSFPDKLHDATYYNIADIFKSIGNYEKAVKYFLKSAEISPYPIYAYQQIGELHSNNGHFDLAFKAFNKALNSKFSIENCYLGMLQNDFYMYEDDSIKDEISVLMNQGINADVFSTFDEDAFLHEENYNAINATIFNQYGYLYIQKEKIDSAIFYFSKATEVSPDFDDAKKNLQMAYYLKNQK